MADILDLTKIVRAACMRSIMCTICAYPTCEKDECSTPGDALAAAREVVRQLNQWSAYRFDVPMADVLKAAETELSK
jgi:hypothetical protein